jgi:wobble nucleotide-excising tRNase
MRIRKLAGAKDCGVFRDHRWPTDLPPMTDRVVIYGWNGVGKTTLASILREAETGRRVFAEGEWEITTDSAPIRSSSLGEDAPALPIRVFNEGFVGDSVFTPDELSPVVYVGKGTREKRERLESCTKELAEAEERARTLGEAKAKADGDLDSFYADQAKAIKEALRSSGVNRYNNYDRSDYGRRVEELAALPAGSPALADAEREQLRSTMGTRPMEVVSLISAVPAIDDGLVRETRQLLGATPSSTQLQRLAADPAVGSWAEAGLRLHEERSSSVCLFCTSPLAENTLADLRGHFDPAFHVFVRRIDELLDRVQSIRRRGEEIQPPLPVQMSPSLLPAYQESLDAFSRRRLEFVAKARTLEAHLQAKRDAPFAAINLEVAFPTSLLIDLGDVNGLLAEHNSEQAELSTRVAQARDVLADDLIVQQRQRIEGLHARISDVTAELKSAREARDRLRDEEARLKQEVVEHVTPGAELTAQLASFLGRDDITFKTSGTGYTISRLGKPAKARSLSEGERSAIALLYFLKTLRDQSFNRDEGVVVIDDPVSSLDSNALFCALGYIQSETEDIGQLIFLTHNFAFFRELRNWLNQVRGNQPSACSLYFMRCAGPSTSRHACLEPLDPLLANYDSEYQYLFKLVWEASQDSNTGLDRWYHCPNVARRLLEAFLAFRMPDLSHVSLRGRLKQADLDPSKRERLLRFLHFQSHADGVDIPEEDLSSLAETPEVMRDLLQFMRQQDKAHYERMLTIVAPGQGA